MTLLAVVLLAIIVGTRVATRSGSPRWHLLPRLESLSRNVAVACRPEYGSECHVR
jgi:hypothetical protein